jgi:hypothetical protein
MNKQTLINRIVVIVDEIADRNKHQWNNDKPIVQAETLISLLDNSLEKTILTYRVDALAETAYANEREQSRYNGWTNYETWCVNLWIDSYDEDEIAAMDDVAEIARYIESLVDELNPVTENSMFSDILSANLREVHYSEIAEHWFNDTNDARKARNGVTEIDITIRYTFESDEDKQSYIEMITEDLEAAYPDAMIDISTGSKERIFANGSSNHEEIEAISDIIVDVFNSEEWINEPLDRRIDSAIKRTLESK